MAFSATLSVHPTLSFSCCVHKSFLYVCVYTACPGNRFISTIFLDSTWMNVNNMNVEVAQSCPTLCYPMAYIVHGILQAKILEWVAVPFSTGSSQPRNQPRVSCIAGGFFTRSPYTLKYDLPKRMFHIHLRSLCILLLLEEMFHRCVLGLLHL